MQSHIAPLAWEYFARNRWKFLLPFIANIPASLILLPFAGLEPVVAAKELVSIQIILTLSMALIVGFCVQESQGSFRRFYLKPISTFHLVSFYFWTGALLVAIVVATLLALWYWIVPLGFQISGPVLFAVVCWCSFQPIFRGVLKSLAWIPIIFALLSSLMVWYLNHFGIPLKRGGMMDSRIHEWTSISIADLLFACLVIAVSFTLTLWRVSQDRCGMEHSHMTFLEKFNQYVEHILEKRFGVQKFFASPSHALRWFDFHHRSKLIPASSILGLITVWIILVFKAILDKDLTSPLAVVVAATHGIAFFLPLFAWMLSIIGHFGKTSSKLEAAEIRFNNTPFGLYPYLFTLPVQPKMMASAMLRSSFFSSILGFAAILTSFALAGSLGQLFNIQLAETLSLKTPYWKYILFVSTASCLATFACSFFVIAFIPLLLRFELLLGPVAVLAALIFFHTPISFSLTCFCFVLVFSMLVYATIKSIVKKDVSLGAALGIWAIGIALAFLAQRATEMAWNTSPSILTNVLIGLALLPYFSTALALRQVRTK